MFKQDHVLLLHNLLINFRCYNNSSGMLLFLVYVLVPSVCLRLLAHLPAHPLFHPSFLMNDQHFQSVIFGSPNKLIGINSLQFNAPGGLSHVDDRGPQVHSGKVVKLPRGDSLSLMTNSHHAEPLPLGSFCFVDFFHEKT